MRFLLAGIPSGWRRVHWRWSGPAATCFLGHQTASTASWCSGTRWACSRAGRTCGTIATSRSCDRPARWCWDWTTELCSQYRPWTIRSRCSNQLKDRAWQQRSQFQQNQVIVYHGFFVIYNIAVFIVDTRICINFCTLNISLYPYPSSCLCYSWWHHIPPKLRENSSPLMHETVLAGTSLTNCGKLWERAGR